MNLELNLQAVLPELHDQAREAFSTDDGSGFAYCAIGSQDRLRLVADNLCVTAAEKT
jgi:hypothetical protein